MKKLSIFATLLLALGFASCVEKDNAVGNTGKTVNYEGVNYQVDLIATFEGEQGAEVELALGSWNEDGDVCGIDFGDGNVQSFKIGYKDQTIPDENGVTHNAAAPENMIKGKVSGDGIIKLYGHYDIAFARLVGDIIPTTLNQPRLMNVEDLGFSGAKVETIEFPALEQLTTLIISNTPIKTVDVSKLTALKTLRIFNTGESPYESSALESIDLSANTKLETLTLGTEFYKPGILTTLDLSNNPKLYYIAVANNKLKSIVLPEGADITTLNVCKNELTALDLSKLGSIKNITANDNMISELDLSKLQAKGFLYLSNNALLELTVPVDVKTLDARDNILTKVSIKNVTTKLALEDNGLTFSTLPPLPAGLASTVSSYTYAPQDIVVEVKLDFLGAYNFAETPEYGPFKGILAEGDAKTVITFKTDEGAYTDFTEKDGVYTFTRVCNKVSGELTNAAFPELTLPTTPFAIKTYGTDPTETEDTPAKKIYIYGDPANPEQAPFVPAAGNAAEMRFSSTEGLHLPTIPDEVYFGLKTLIFDVSDVSDDFDLKVMNGWWSATYYDHVKWVNGLNKLQITEDMANDCAKGAGGRDLDLMLYSGSMTLKAVYYEE